MHGSNYYLPVRFFVRTLFTCSILSTINRIGNSSIVGGPIGYVALGRDKTRKTRAKGTLVVTDKALYCAGNVYPYDKVISITRNRKSILLILIKEFEEQRFTSTLELKTDDRDGLFKALEAARMKQIQF